MDSFFWFVIPSFALMIAEAIGEHRFVPLFYYLGIPIPFKKIRIPARYDHPPGKVEGTWGVYQFSENRILIRVNNGNWYWDKGNRSFFIARAHVVPYRKYLKIVLVLPLFQLMYVSIFHLIFFSIFSFFSLFVFVSGNIAAILFILLIVAFIIGMNYWNLKRSYRNISRTISELNDILNSTDQQENKA